MVAPASAAHKHAGIRPWAVHVMSSVSAKHVVAAEGGASVVRVS